MTMLALHCTEINGFQEDSQTVYQENPENKTRFFQIRSIKYETRVFALICVTSAKISIERKQNEHVKMFVASKKLRLFNL